MDTPAVAGPGSDGHFGAEQQSNARSRACKSFESSRRGQGRARGAPSATRRDRWARPATVRRLLPGSGGSDLPDPFRPIPPASVSATTWTCSAGPAAASNWPPRTTDVQQEALRAAQLGVASDTVLEALQVASTRAQIDVVKSVIASDQRTLGLVQSRLAAGAASDQDVTTAQSQLDRDRTLLPALHQQLNMAQDALATLVGQFAR